MLLVAVDIGNTNVVIGVLDDGHIAGTYRITTKSNHTSDEYGLMITQFLQLSGYTPDDVDDVIISSVVPKVMHSFRASIVKFLNIDPMIIGPLRVWRSDSGGGFRHGHHIQLRNSRRFSDLRTDHHRHSHGRGRLVGGHGPVAGSGNHPPRIDSGEKHQTSHAGRLVLQLPRRHRTYDHTIPSRNRRRIPRGRDGWFKPSIC